MVVGGYSPPPLLPPPRFPRGWGCCGPGSPGPSSGRGQPGGGPPSLCLAPGVPAHAGAAGRGWEEQGEQLEQLLVEGGCHGAPGRW